MSGIYFASFAFPVFHAHTDDELQGVRTSNDEMLILRPLLRLTRRRLQRCKGM